jgi:multicomponent Na+:H+ antiporter subunit C
METLLAFMVGALFACGIYLILRRSLLRILFGIILLSNAVNLCIFLAGRVLLPASPPLVPEGLDVPAVAVSNPLPQALVLTAIVIGFGMMAFVVVLGLRAHATLSTDHVDGVGGRGGEWDEARRKP